MALLLAWLIARWVSAPVYADVFQRHWAPIAFGVLAGAAITSAAPWRPRSAVQETTRAATAMVARYLAARRDRSARREVTEPIAERIAS